MRHQTFDNRIFTKIKQHETMTVAIWVRDNEVGCEAIGSESSADRLEIAELCRAELLEGREMNAILVPLQASSPTVRRRTNGRMREEKTRHIGNMARMNDEAGGRLNPALRGRLRRIASSLRLRADAPHHLVGAPRINLAASARTVGQLAWRGT
jgi:hypothetical protein